MEEKRVRTRGVSYQKLLHLFFQWHDSPKLIQKQKKCINHPKSDASTILSQMHQPSQVRCINHPKSDASTIPSQVLTISYSLAFFPSRSPNAPRLGMTGHGQFSCPVTMWKCTTENAQRVVTFIRKNGGIFFQIDIKEQQQNGEPMESGLSN